MPGTAERSADSVRLGLSEEKIAEISLQQHRSGLDQADEPGDVPRRDMLGENGLAKESYDVVEND